MRTRNDDGHPRGVPLHNFNHSMFYWLMWSFCRFIRMFFFPLTVVGGENIPKTGAFIFASNHRSHLDPMIVPICTTRKICFVAKEELFQKQPLGWILRHLNSIPIRRESADHRAMKTVLNRLSGGTPVLIFPEGTRVVNEAERQIQAGVGWITLKAAVPVVPIYIEGTDKVLPPHAKKLTRHPVKITFGQPVTLTQIPPKEYQSASEAIMQAILALSGNL
ncbi:MAG: 1-acyl-sn-glycerol-3-phosphate acyltransferase [Candidatus Omnitrophica bacterium]|nr:1-acyl-sn-glycerol-3-phosphate acyltransferase [Candidatus Omnitrophota bacterium]